MKLNSKMMAAVVMMAGSLAVVGCQKANNDSSNEPVAPEQTADEAAVENETPGVEQDARRVHYYAPHAPPRIRVEERGRAPSERHFWSPGYHRWNGREHVWVRGRWEPRRSGYEYVGPRWIESRGRWEYIPGHWSRR